MRAPTPEARLADLGWTLPDPPKPVALYVPARRSGELLFISGQVPLDDGTPVATGCVPGRVSEEVAVACAKRCALSALSAARVELGSLDKIAGVIRLGVFVASDAGYGGQPRIANAASEVMIELFGDAGRHARAALGCPALPLDVPVEVEATFQIAQ
ncbi:MAG: RidA family protein [Planctomycetota bacterium]